MAGMKLLFALLAFLPIAVPAQAAKEEAAPLLGTQKHLPISVHQCTCAKGFLKDSRIPSSKCQASIHGKIQEVPVYNDICHSLELTQRAEGPSESATSFLGPREVIVGVSYGDQSFEISEEWMKAVITEAPSSGGASSSAPPKE
jgi:hypothetical protein